MLNQSTFDAIMVIIDTAEELTDEERRHYRNVLAAPYDRKLFCPQEAAKYIGMSIQALRLWTSQKKIVPIRVTRKTVLYRQVDLDALMRNRLTN